MKKSILISILILFATSVIAAETKFHLNGLSYSIVSNDEVKVIKGEKMRGEITIPSNVEYNNNKYFVVEIDNKAFYENTELEKVFLPNTIKVIGENAFYNCNNLNFIILPNSIQKISDYSFAFCNKIEILSLIDHNIDLSKNCFKGCGLVRDEYDSSNSTSLLYYPYYQANNIWSTLKEVRLHPYLKYFETKSDFIDKNSNYNYMLNYTLNKGDSTATLLSLTKEGRPIEFKEEAIRNADGTESLYFRGVDFSVIKVKDYDTITNITYMECKKDFSALVGRIYYDSDESRKIKISAIVNDVFENINIDSLYINSDFLLENPKLTHTKNIIVQGKKEMSKEIKIKTPGTLKDLFKSSNDTKITTLKLIGKIDIRDLKYIVDNLSLLENLDLKDVDIEYYDKTHELENLPYNAVYRANNLENLNENRNGKVIRIKSLILPKSIKTISENALFPELTNLEIPLKNIKCQYNEANKIILPNTIKTLILYSDSNKVVFSKIHDNKNNSIPINNLNYTDCSLLLNAFNCLSTIDFSINKISSIVSNNQTTNIMQEKFFSGTNLFYINETKRRLIEIYNSKINANNILSTNNIKINDVLSSGIDVVNDDVFFSINDIVKNNIWGYFNGITGEYNTDLKKSVYMKSSEYRSLDSIFQIHKKIFHKSIKYFRWSKNSESRLFNSDSEHKLYELSAYNTKTNTFRIIYNRINIEHEIYPRNFIYSFGEYFLLPSIPTETSSKFVFPANRVIPRASYDYESSLSIKVDEVNALKIEENNNDIDIYFVFENMDIDNNSYNINDIKYTFKIVQKVKMIIANTKTGEIYYSKLYEPAPSAPKKKK